MKLGVEDRNKVVALGVLMLVAGYFFYENVLSTPSSSPSPAPRPVAQRNADADAATAPATAPPPQSARPRSLVNRNSKGDDFHPVLRPKGREGDAEIDPNTVDPTIHIELLAKVQNMKLEGGQRNLFQFGAAPPPELKGKEPKVELVAKVYDYPRPFVPKPPDPAQGGPAAPAALLQILRPGHQENRQQAYGLLSGRGRHHPGDRGDDREGPVARDADRVGIRHAGGLTDPEAAIHGDFGGGRRQWQLVS